MNFSRSVTQGLTDTQASAAASGIYYDPIGREVGQPAKGIYIADGKKVVVKESPDRRKTEKRHYI